MGDSTLGGLTTAEPERRGGAGFAPRQPAAQMPGRTIRVHAGDMVGASPLISSYFHDEPSVDAMNLMRFDVGTLGNHEFGEGAGEALRLLRGGRRGDGHELKRDESGRLVNTSQPDYLLRCHSSGLRSSTSPRR